MNAPVKLASFGLALAVVFTAALGLGRVAGGPDPTPAATHDLHAATTATATAGATDADAETPAGLQISQDGYRLVPLTGELATGASRPFTFRILGADGAPVTAYKTSHDRDMHLIVVRRDLSGYQHVHPTLGPDDTWTVPLAVAAAGQYRVFADFVPAGRDTGLVLGADIPAPGDYRPRPLPAAARTTTVDGYTVTLAGDLAPGGSARLTLSVSRGGRPVTDLQPYLGAYGHLVVLRDGDLAYLHVHPDGTPGDGRTAAGPGVVFHADVPSAGSYRLHFDFQHGGRVRTAEFTAVAGQPVQAQAPAPASSAAEGEGHSHD